MAQLTVGITYYNEGPLLTQCLESFWKGSQRPDQIILYDDASQDRPDSYIPKEIPVKILRGEKNRGPAYGRNRILEAVETDWVHFHDADDTVDTSWAEKVMAAATDSDVVLTELISYQNDRVLSGSVLGLSEWKTSGGLAFAIRHFILPAAGTFRTELARKMGGYRESLWQSEDWDFYIRLLLTGPRVCVLEESLVRIQVRSESRSQKQIETLSCVLQAILLLEREVPQEYRQALAEKAAWAGSRLFQLQEKQMAREAFSLAETLGPATHSQQNKSYRWIAHHWGQEAAEWVAWTYRQVLPQTLRRKLNG